MCHSLEEPKPQLPNWLILTANLSECRGAAKKFTINQLLEDIKNGESDVDSDAIDESLAQDEETHQLIDTLLRKVSISLRGQCPFCIANPPQR